MDYLKVFLLSALPVVELRGGLPLGISLGMPWWEAFVVSYLGNIVIIYPWLLVLEHLEGFLARNRITAPVYKMLIRKVSKKKELFAKYGKYALLFLLPFPTDYGSLDSLRSRPFSASRPGGLCNNSFWCFGSGSIMLLYPLLLAVFNLA